jgi:hypothetical protein
MRRLLQTLFAIFLLSAILLVVISYINQEWQTITAAISLIIAIISGWIAFEVFYRQSQSEKPQIILRFDFRSRHSLVLLIAENLGKKPAFDIKIKWNKELLDFESEPVKFNKYDNITEISVLNPNEHTSVVVDVPETLFERYKGDEMDFGGTITFKENIASKRTTSYPFFLSLRHYGNSPVIETEEPKTMFELQKIPQKLDDIKKELSKILKKHE